MLVTPKQFVIKIHVDIDDHLYEANDLSSQIMKSYRRILKISEKLFFQDLSLNVKIVSIKEEKGFEYVYQFKISTPEEQIPLQRMIMDVVFKLLNHLINNANLREEKRSLEAVVEDCYLEITKFGVSEISQESHDKIYEHAKKIEVAVLKYPKLTVNIMKLWATVPPRSVQNTDDEKSEEGGALKNEDENVETGRTNSDQGGLFDDQNTTRGLEITPSENTPIFEEKKVYPIFKLNSKHRISLEFHDFGRKANIEPNTAVTMKLLNQLNQSPSEVTLLIDVNTDGYGKYVAHDLV